MYPYDLFLGMDLYEILMVLSFFAALLYFRFWADRRGFGAKLQNLCILGAMPALFGGYGAAVLAQAFYNFLDDGTFRIAADTGATFYGGLIGGAAIFLVVYFVGGRILKLEPTEHFFEVTEIAGGSIALAHGIGRLGCLFAGCCHGRVTDAWYGITNVALGAKTVPVQLFEALFLFALTAFLTWRLSKGKRGNLGGYLIVYAIWRFLAEYMRGDDRGQSPVPFLSPSQLTAVVLLLIGIGVLFLQNELAGDDEQEDVDENA